MPEVPSTHYRINMVLGSPALLPDGVQSRPIFVKKTTDTKLRVSNALYNTEKYMGKAILRCYEILSIRKQISL